MLCVRRRSDAGPAGRVRCWQVQCREPKKQDSKMFISITKMIHFAYLGILFIYACTCLPHASAAENSDEKHTATFHL